jgi:hypothetical protein
MPSLRESAEGGLDGLFKARAIVSFLLTREFLNKNIFLTVLTIGTQYNYFTFEKYKDKNEVF